MKVWVDADKCQGHARCEAMAPELFAVDPDTHLSHVVVDQVPPSLETFARNAVASCPERAISVLEAPDVK